MTIASTAPVGDDSAGRVQECHEDMGDEPCGRPAIAWRQDPTFGEPYPVCRKHVRSPMVPLAVVSSTAPARDERAIAAKEMRDRADRLVEHYGVESHQVQDLRRWADVMDGAR